MPATLTSEQTPAPGRTYFNHTVMRIVVGSTNPVKINAAKTAIQLAFPALKEQVQIMGMAAPSLVSDQPMGDTETLRGGTEPNAVRHFVQRDLRC